MVQLNNKRCEILYRYHASLINVLQVLLWVVLVPAVTAVKVCQSGTYVYHHGSGSDICRVCEEGKTFMPEENHSRTQCINCSQIVQPEVEVVITECNLQHDAVIQCQDGYYRKKARNGRAKDECVSCSICDHVTRPCMNYTDAVCCSPNHDAVQLPTGVFYCKERPILCQAGQFFNNKTEQCLPCPSHTYMPDRDHNHQKCVPHAQLIHSLTFNSDVIFHGTGTSPTLFGCKNGYWRNLSEASPIFEINCTKCDPCTETKIQKPCFHFQDSVCAPFCFETQVIVTDCSTIQNSTRQDCPDHCLSLPTRITPSECSEVQLVLPLSLVLGSVIAISVIVFVMCFIRKKGCFKQDNTRKPEEMNFM